METAKDCIRYNEITGVVANSHVATIGYIDTDGIDQDFESSCVLEGS